MKYKHLEEYWTDQTSDCKYIVKDEGCGCSHPNNSRKMRYYYSSYQGTVLRNARCAIRNCPLEMELII